MRFTKSFLGVAAVVLTLNSPLAAEAGQLHVFTSGDAGFNTHSVWYDDGKEVTVIDTQFTIEVAQQLVADIQKQTKSPITRIIITYPNPDKFNALSVFHKLGAESIASAKTAAAIPGVDAYKRYFWVEIAHVFTDETYPKVEPVKTTFSGQKVIKLKSGETITLIELKEPGVSNNQVVVRIDTTGDLIVGDLVAYKAHAWLEGGIVDGKTQPNIAGWKADLQQLLTLGKGKVYGGRGEFGLVTEVVPVQIAYLDKADQIVTNYVKKLGNNALAELTDPVKSQAHFQEIQAEFVKAFPNYALPDLIRYGVYGLAFSKISSK
ncbi:MAG: MBL fold metallo-hydrolase [Rhodospirillaceae bacterium]|nr:MBL fold metallo-hydrolase [Rhodospirillaceae bacterium]